MSLSSALNNALSGLNASARDAATVSSNLANTLTEGYAPRSLNRASSSFGGVTLHGVSRHVNLALLQDLRYSSANLAGADIELDGLSRMQTVVGTPGEPDSMSTAIDRFQSSLISAANRPDLDLRLETAVHDARSIASKLNSATVSLQTLRAEADRAISQEVDTLNSRLSRVEALNKDIAAATLKKQDSAALVDQRQALIDEIAKQVPLRLMPRDHGAVALVSTRGMVLLDSRATHFEFTQTPTISPHMRIENGFLSGISANGKTLATTDGGPLAGGTISGHLALRDQYFPDAQNQLDDFALDLATRFQSGVDPTLGASDPGLFTDNGAIATTSVGLAGRLAVNTQVDPSQGGFAWRLRDGLGTASPGASGNATLLNNMLDRLNEPLTSSGVLTATPQSSAELTGTLSSAFAVPRARVENEVAYHTHRHAALNEAALADGVDSDAELQRLMLVEQSYAANARMIQTVDEMLQTLMRIGA